MKYDDANWHSAGEFPEDSPVEYGATHIALFLKWCFVNGWAGEIHLKEWPDETQAVIDGTVSATSFFLKNCDGKFTDEDLCEDGNRFAKKYYGDDGLYFEDYSREFFDLIYVAPEESHNFQTFSAMIDQRRKSGVLTQTDLSRAKP